MNRKVWMALALAVAGAAWAEKPLYTVVDGNKVDPDTLKGFRTWRQAACDRCHGPNQEGMVGPSLIDSLKVMTKEQFVTTVTNGRVEKGMPPWSTSKNVMDNIDHLYAYLKGRSDGKITKAHVVPMDSPAETK
ncbi:MAG: c-type cytochrome [Burkholderiales bacterium]|nr:c-type cytochrome [Burkholderiales bacterium]